MGSSSSNAARGYIGARIERIEDRPLLTGTATFIDDVELDGQVHVAFLRSPLAHARVNAIDTAAARALPGVELVVTAADVDVGPLTAPIENELALLTPRP